MIFIIVKIKYIKNFLTRYFQKEGGGLVKLIESQVFLLFVFPYS